MRDERARARACRDESLRDEFRDRASDGDRTHAQLRHELSARREALTWLHPASPISEERRGAMDTAIMIHDDI
jgi:hypothetical protein